MTLTWNFVENTIIGDGRGDIAFVQVKQTKETSANTNKTCLYR